jgi:hypothetical protein
MFKGIRFNRPDALFHCEIIKSASEAVPNGASAVGFTAENKWGICREPGRARYRLETGVLPSALPMRAESQRKNAIDAQRPIAFRWFL